jgi:protein MpaA
LPDTSTTQYAVVRFHSVRVAHAAATGLLVALGVTCVACTPSPSPASRSPLSPPPPTASRSPLSPPAAPSPAAPAVVAGAGLVHRTVRLTTTRAGTPVVALHLGNPARPAVLVVGCIHGNETAGIAVADLLARLPAGRLAAVNLWIVATLNPDGVRRGTRVNSDGVDLNRNFPARWQPLGRRGDIHYAGPAPASEPETVAMVQLLKTVRPAVGIWFHQALAVVDTSEGPAAPEKALAQALRLPEQALPDYPGSAVGFDNTLVRRSAFVVELAAGPLGVAARRRAADAILALAAGLPGRR